MSLDHEAIYKAYPNVITIAREAKDKDGNVVSLDNSKIATARAELDAAEAPRLLRVKRDWKLAKSDWIIIKAIETGGTIPTAWKTYRQALRDLPASSSPKLASDRTLDQTSVTWPTEPS